MLMMGGGGIPTNDCDDSEEIEFVMFATAEVLTAELKILRPVCHIGKLIVLCDTEIIN